MPTFEQKLHSLQVGCTIVGIFQLLSFINALNGFSDGTSGLGTVILSGLILLDIIFAYYFTSKKNPIGPVLEYILGVLLIIYGIFRVILAFVIIPGWFFAVFFLAGVLELLIDIVCFIAGIGILKEANWFQNYINNNAQ